MTATLIGTFKGPINRGTTSIRRRQEAGRNVCLIISASSSPGNASMAGDQRHEQCPALANRRRPRAASTPACVTMSLAFLITTFGLTSAISLDEALVADMIPDDADPSTVCQDPGTTTFTFDWPGQNNESKWDPRWRHVENETFLAQMEHIDQTNSSRSWTIRFGTGGNIYSLFSPNGYGEAMPPQARTFAPFVDELHQSVVVAQHLNTPTDPYFIHQAGIYTKDPPYTNKDFFSPNLARHCANNSCTFVSWGQQAHVPTKYPSPALFINRYTNCGGGLIEFTHTVQNIAAKGAVYERFTYLNLPWSGIRESTLPDVLTPDSATSTLTIDPSNGDVRTTIFGWGEPEEVASATNFEPGATAGYTTFAAKIWPNETAVAVDLPCIKPEGDCSNGALPDDPTNCMVSNCSDDQIANEGYERMVLQVASVGTHCQRRLDHPAATRTNNLLLRCQLRPKGGYGKQYGTELGEYILKNSTGHGIRINQIYHWSWALSKTFVDFFVTDYPDDDSWQDTLKGQIEETFPPGENITLSTYAMPEPEGYDPSTVPSLTYIHGKGEEYESGYIDGQGRIRIGTTHRDCKIFTKVHYQTQLLPRETFVTRQYMFSGALGDVESIATSLVNSTYDSTFMDQVAWNEMLQKRSIHIYTSEADAPGVFGVAAADEEGGTSTSCSTGTVICTGSTNYGYELFPFFAVSCGSKSYFGRDLYRFAPGRNHSTDIFFQGGILQPYACEGEPVDVRPTWKLIGYFDPAEEGCASLENYTYSEDFCAADPSNPIEESELPSSIPSLQPTVEESLAPSPDPSQPTTAEESDRPSSLPSIQPTVEKSPTPSLVPSQSPTVEGSQLPSSTPSHFPTGDMTEAPTNVEYPMNLPCIKPNSDCTNGAGPNDDENNCMVDQCTDKMIANVGYERMVLRVPAEGTKCVRHSYSSTLKKLVLSCQLHEANYGRMGLMPTNRPYKFTNTTGGSIYFSRIHHWSWTSAAGAPTKYTTFWTNYPDDDTWNTGPNSLKVQIEETLPPDMIVKALLHVPS